MQARHGSEDVVVLSPIALCKRILSSRHERLLWVCVLAVLLSDFVVPGYGGSARTAALTVLWGLQTTRRADVLFKRSTELHRGLNSRIAMPHAFVTALTQVLLPLNVMILGQCASMLSDSLDDGDTPAVSTTLVWISVLVAMSLLEETEWYWVGRTGDLIAFHVAAMCCGCIVGSESFFGGMAAVVCAHMSTLLWFGYMQIFSPQMASAWRSHTHRLCELFGVTMEEELEAIGMSFEGVMHLSSLSVSACLPLLCIFQICDHPFRAVFLGVVCAFADGCPPSCLSDSHLPEWQRKFLQKVRKVKESLSSRGLVFRCPQSLSDRLHEYDAYSICRHWGRNGYPDVPLRPLFLSLERAKQPQGFRRNLPPCAEPEMSPLILRFLGRSLRVGKFRECVLAYPGGMEAVCREMRREVARIEWFVSTADQEYLHRAHALSSDLQPYATEIVIHMLIVLHARSEAPPWVAPLQEDTKLLAQLGRIARCAEGWGDRWCLAGPEPTAGSPLQQSRVECLLLLARLLSGCHRRPAVAPVVSSIMAQCSYALWRRVSDRNCGLPFLRAVVQFYECVCEGAPADFFVSLGVEHVAHPHMAPHHMPPFLHVISITNAALAVSVPCLPGGLSICNAWVGTVAEQAAALSPELVGIHIAARLASVAVDVQSATSASQPEAPGAALYLVACALKCLRQLCTISPRAVATVRANVSLCALLISTFDEHPQVMVRREARQLRAFLGSDAVAAEEVPSWKGLTEAELGTYLRKTEGASEDCCSICLSEIEQPVQLPCGHMFHDSCVRVWLFSNVVCPQCRQDLRTSPAPSAYVGAASAAAEPRSDQATDAGT
eukprot:TRINITY_DN43461_c0_g1_i1.p1 TRINITY_DN43461_c0_g1~~TRINITY_DN43461_c0_g1_i1.p1  ORF type:complete len:851 (+),score=164.81 TRINITY_DN43461_c0_g1_i1:53-2554(+)